MNRPNPILMFLAALALAAGATIAGARAHDDAHRGNQEKQERVERPRARISLDQAVAMAERRYNARVVRADSRESDGHIVYVLRLLNESGRVWTVKVDATSGDMR